MNGAQPRSKGVSGKAQACPDQGAPVSDPTLEQSCPTANQPDTSTYFRFSLPASHARRWLALPPRLRKQAAGIVFGSYTMGIRLEDLPTVGSELREARTAINNALQLALIQRTSPDMDRINSALDKINSLLGQKP
jgi:hypothetical protein